MTDFAELVCGRGFAARRDGKVRTHRAPNDDGRCPGSNELPGQLGDSR